MNNTQCILDALKIATDTKAFELGEGVLHRAPALFKEYFPNRKAVIVAVTIQESGRRSRRRIHARGGNSLRAFPY